MKYKNTQNTTKTKTRQQSKRKYKNGNTKKTDKHNKHIYNKITENKNKPT